MKRITILAMLALSACATMPPPAPPREATPTRALQSMTTGVLPRLELREMALGATLDSIVRGSPPTGAGQIICSTGSGTAAFESAATCGLASGTNYWALSGGILSTSGATTPNDVEIDEASSTTSTPSVLGWSAAHFTAGTAMLIRMGDGGGLSLLSAFSDKSYILNYHGLVLEGGRNTTALVTPATGGGSADTSVEIIGSSSGGALKISTSSTTGTAIKLFKAGTAISAPAAVGAQSCSSNAIIVTGATTGSPCFPILPAAWTSNLAATCFASGSGAAKLQFCNPTTGSITPPSSTNAYNCACLAL